MKTKQIKPIKIVGGNTQYWSTRVPDSSGTTTQIVAECGPGNFEDLVTFKLNEIISVLNSLTTPGRQEGKKKKI